MIALIQRVQEAKVTFESRIVGEIGPGLLAYVGVEAGDTESQAGRILARILGYRIFADSSARMNLCLSQVSGGLLLVPQFTLAADTTKGMRPSFSPAAEPALGELLFHRLVALAIDQHPQVATGQFGADMQVHSVNDGPVTFWLHAKPNATPTNTVDR